MGLIMLLLGIVIFGAIVFFHELGHFIAAKKVGIRVNVFSIGFGKRLLGFKHGDTDYRVSLMPFGGYVAMAGEESRDRKGEKEEFGSKSPLERFFVIIMGPIMNFLLAALILWFGVLMGEPKSIENTNMRVGYIKPNSIADTIGMKHGDVVKTINGEMVSEWTMVYKRVMFSSRNAKITFSRQGEVFEKTFAIERNKMTGIIDFGLYPDLKPEVEKTTIGSPAEKAGIIAGDIIIKLNENAVSCWDEFAQRLDDIYKNNPQETVTITLQRNEELITVPVRAQKIDGKFKIGVIRKRQEFIQRVPFLQSFKIAKIKYMEMVNDTISAFKLFATNAISTKTLSGPIGIIQVTSEVAKFGLRSLMIFIAFLSINLGIINLLPIPITDGGQIMFIMLEKILGKPLETKTTAIITNVSLFALVALALYVTYNDLIRILSN